jgi:alpha-tubulin suppressor-like RCC1 family protein
MPITKIKTHNLDNFAITTDKMANTAVAAFAQSLAPKVLYANVANSAFSVLDDTAVNVGGGYIVVTGSDFVSGATVLVDTTAASAVTFVNSTTLRVQVPSKAAASYNLYVVNPDGGVGIKVNGVSYSTDPIWVTSSPLGNQVANIAFNVTLSATGASSYSVAAGSTLPAGTTLAANGYFSGTVSIGAETTYTFSVVATDAENQDASKTFQVTVTVPDLYKLWSWGYGGPGVLGHNNTVDKSSPTQVGSGINWSSISTRYNTAHAIKDDGTLWAWGSSDTYGALGHNDTVYKSSPTQVGAGTTWSSVSNSRFTAAAIKTDGTLWTWGDNSYGNLGTNDKVHRSSPTQVGASTNWSKIKVSDFIAIAIKTDGTLWSWGANYDGGLGLNTITQTYRSSPVQVGASTNWSKIAVSHRQRSTVAIKTDGTLWSWGNNGFGELGLNDSVKRSSPVQIGTDTNWSLISFGYKSCIAIKTNGTLWSWGQNNQGRLGLNDAGTYSTARSSPTQIGTGTTWSLADIGEQNAMAVKTDGTLWSWGANAQGQLGINAGFTYRSSPVQVGASTNWTQISVGVNNMLAITTN